MLHNRENVSPSLKSYKNISKNKLGGSKAENVQIELESSKLSWKFVQFPRRHGLEMFRFHTHVAWKRDKFATQFGNVQFELEKMVLGPPNWFFVNLKVFLIFPYPLHHFGVFLKFAAV